MTKLYSWLFGPGSLGGTIGVIVAALVLKVHFWLVQPGLDRDFWVGTAAGLACAWAAGAFAGLQARDEFLRNDWAHCRWLVGLCGGAVIGGCFALYLWDLRLFIAGLLGGAFGGVSDAVVHRNQLEEGD